jgi:pyruvate dehydrogenase (quinone)
VMPPAITVEMAKGFSLYMLRAVMNGHADQVIDPAESNLWR